MFALFTCLLCTLSTDPTLVSVAQYSVYKIIGFKRLSGVEAIFTSWSEHFQPFMEPGVLSSRLVFKRNAYRILVGRAEGKRSLGIRRRRWEDNIKMDHKRDRMGWYGLDRSGSG
jgi:hypothetical protein